MEYKFEELGDVLKITLTGRLVAACTEDFRDQMLPRLDKSAAVLFDLSGMTHIDSSGLGMLVQLLQRAHEHGGSIRLAALQPHPRIVFDITKVCRLFEIFETVEEGLASFEK